MSHSQSQRLLAFGVDARILNLRLITIFTSYSLARTMASVRVVVRGQRKLQLLPQLLLEEEKMLLLMLHQQLPRPPARPRGMLPLGAGSPPPVLLFLSGRFFFPHVR